MKLKIKHRWTGDILFSIETDSFKLAIEAAVKAGANLQEADLQEADLWRADLSAIRDDFFNVLSTAPVEVAGLREAIMSGKIDGSTYTGDCACLVGTIAKIKHCDYKEIPNLSPNSSRPIERFFLAIKKGDNPENSQLSKLAVEWLDIWVENRKAAFGGVK